MALDDVVQLTITRNSKAPTKAGFGRPMIAGYHTKFAARAKLYRNPDDMLTDGFTTSDQLYKLAVAVKSQQPSPKDFYIGRCALPPTQVIELVPSPVANTTVYSGKFNTLPFTFTSDSSATLAEICTGVAAAITALAGVTATGASGTKVVSSTDAPGAIAQYTELVGFQVHDATVDPGIATDLAAIYAYTKDWYGLILASNSEAEIDAAAAWVETKRRLFAATNADTLILDPGTTTDVASDLKGSNYFRTCLWFHHEVGSTLAAAIMAQRLTSVPGSDTWAHKSVVGPAVSPESLIDAGAETALQAKRANYYIELAGNGNTYEGRVASGEWIDIIRLIDFLYARIQERVIGVFQANAKIAFTDTGADALAGAVQTVLQNAEKPPINGLVPGSSVVTKPLVADIDPTDKANRFFPDIEFSAAVSGAVHAVGITGNLV